MSTSVLFAGVDPREGFELFWGRQVFHRVELELGLKVISYRSRNDAVIVQSQ